MKYPTLEQVEAANQEQLCRWFRFLPVGKNDSDLAVVNRVFERVREGGGFTPEISKRIGW